MTTAITPTLLDPALLADPRAVLARMREQAPVHRGTDLDGTPVWIVTGYAEARELLGDPAFSADPDSVPGGTARAARAALLREQFGIAPELVPYLTDNILSADGADHTRLRRLVSGAFTVRRVAALRPRVEQITAELFDALPDRAELVEAFAYPLPIRVICELVGVPEADRPAWRRWGTVLSALDPATLPEAVREMVEHTRDLIARRRAEPGDDLLTDLVQARDADGDRLSESELVTMVFALVMAGHETTAHLVSNGALALLTRPDQLALLRADPGLWPGAVHELMRLHGPVIITGYRYATADRELGGVRIARGDKLQAALGSANTDPREFAAAERFDVTRRPSGRGAGHLGFGHGAHYCLGAALARQECEVALHALVERFPRLHLLDDEPDWMPRPGMRRLASLRVGLR